MHNKLFILLFLLLTVGLTVHAERYWQHCDGPMPSTKNPELWAPEGWARIAGAGNIYGDLYYMKYRINEYAGKQGSCIQAPYQRVNDPDYEEYREVQDLIVTPAVTGHVSFWIKAQSSVSLTYVELYYCKKTDDSYSATELIKRISSADIPTDEWLEETLEVSGAQYIGFRLSNVMFDEFSADIPVTSAALSVDALELVDANPMPDTDGVTTVAYKATVTNSGSTALNPGDEGYSLSIEQYYTDRSVISTTPIDVALEPGASATVNISADVPAGEKKKEWRFDVVENISSTRTQGKWVWIYPYKAEMTLQQGDSEVKGAISFGIVADEPASRELTIVSAGGAPLNITNITFSQGYKSDIELPLTLNNGESKTFAVTLGKETEGVHIGKMTIEAEGLSPIEYPLYGGVAGADNYFVDFEGGLPANMLQFDPLQYEMFWSAIDLNQERYAGRGVGAKAAECGGMAMLVTPRLHIAEGEGIIFSAAQKSYSSVLNVYTSTDRIEWTQVLSIGGVDEYGGSVEGKEYDCLFSGTKYGGYYSNDYEFTQFAISGIEGTGVYLAFEAGNARLDNIMAGKANTSDVDIIIEGHEHARRAKVNYPGTSRLIVRNLSANTLAADAHTVTLNVDGEEINFDATEDIPSGASAEYAIKYTPHAAGEFPIFATVKAGSTTLSTPATVLRVEDEEATERHEVGTADGRSYRYPLSATVLNSSSQMIYTADELGLAKGDEIVKIDFLGRTISEKQVEYNVTLWLENTSATSATAATARSTEGLMPVWSGKWSPEYGGTIEAPIDILSISLTDAFVYNGGNLRVIVEAKSEDFKSVDFISTSTGQSIVRYADDDAEYAQMSWQELSGRPVMGIYTAYEVPVLSGKITDESTGNAIEGATVTIKSGDVKYSAKSDAEGAYTIKPIQHKLPYQLAVEADGYVASEPQTLSMEDGDRNIDIALKPHGWTGIEEILTDDSDAEYFNLQGIRVTPDRMSTGTYIKRTGNKAVKVFIK